MLAADVEAGAVEARNHPALGADAGNATLWWSWAFIRGLLAIFGNNAFIRRLVAIFGNNANGAQGADSDRDNAMVWGFVRRLFSIFALQALTSTVIAQVFVSLHAISGFFKLHTPATWAVYLCTLSSTPLALYAMLKYRRNYPANMILLAMFTLCMSVSVSMCTPNKGHMLVLSGILTTASTMSLVLFTFLAQWRSSPLTTLIPVLVSAFTAATTFAVIEIWFTPESLSNDLYCLIFTIVLSAFLVYEVKKLARVHTRDELVVAAISLYLEVIKQFIGQASFSFI